MFRPDYFAGLNLPESYKKLQKISQPLYDRVDLNGPGKYTFFKGSQGRSRLYTNFDGQSQFDNPRAFLIMGLRVIPDFNFNDNDFGELSRRGYFTLTIGDKPFIEVPLSVILARTEASQRYGQVNDATFKLDHPILIPSQQIFKPAIDIENPANLPQQPLTLVFDGVLLRPAQ